MITNEKQILNFKEENDVDKNKKREKKPISIRLTEEARRWLNENIACGRFYNNQHAIIYCITHVMENKCITIPDEITAKIQKLIEEGKLAPYIDKKSFIIECVRKTLKELEHS